jgi:hypothetical protein
MEKNQYWCNVKNGKLIEEQGSFFPAIPFIIRLEGTSVDVTFTSTANHTVVYEVKENGSVIAQLEHPDYTPECDVSDVDTHLPLSNKQGKAVVAAFLMLGIGKGKAYHSFSTTHTESFEVIQPFFC